MTPKATALVRSQMAMSGERSIGWTHPASALACWVGDVTRDVNFTKWSPFQDYDFRAAANGAHPARFHSA